MCCYDAIGHLERSILLLNYGAVLRGVFSNSYFQYFVVVGNALFYQTLILNDASLIKEKSEEIEGVVVECRWALLTCLS